MKGIYYNNMDACFDIAEVEAANYIQVRQNNAKGGTNLLMVC